MNMKMPKKKLATLAATVAAAGGLPLAAPPAHAAQVTPAYGACDYYNNDLEVDFVYAAVLCDSSHRNHRDPINRCDVVEIDSGSNWVAAWVGPTLSNLHYVSGGPNTSFENDGDMFCVGDIAINP